jgi:hypothetical protein
MAELIIRPLQSNESKLFFSYPFARVPELWETTRDYAALLAAGQYRPEHTWVAIRDGTVVARACWWTGPEDEQPAALDWLEAEPGPLQVELGTKLLLSAHEQMRNIEGARPDYHLFLPPEWRGYPQIKAAADARLQTALQAGLRPFVERVSYSWSAERDRLRPRSDRLAFRPGDDAQILSVLREVLVDSLDAHSARDIARYGLEKAAEAQLNSLYWFPSPRDWWQLAYTALGELIGLIIPAKNYAGPVISYLGVLPGQRGHGYVDDLLSALVWRLSELAPGEEVLADTDLNNAPMTKAMTRAGFRTTAEHIVLTDAMV